jgi:hypothetical protein
MPETATPSRPKRGPRRSRFTPKSNPDPIRLTPRDFAIVRAIGDNRVLSSHQVWETVGGSKCAGVSREARERGRKSDISATDNVLYQCKSKPQNQPGPPALWGKRGTDRNGSVDPLSPV